MAGSAAVSSKGSGPAMMPLPVREPSFCFCLADGGTTIRAPAGTGSLVPAGTGIRGPAGSGSLVPAGTAIRCAAGDPTGGLLPEPAPGPVRPGVHVRRRFPEAREYRLALQLGQGEVIRDFPQHMRKRRAQRAADGGEQLRGCFLLTPLNLGEISERYTRGRRDFTEGATLPETKLPQRVTEQVTKQDHRRTPFLKPSP